jgi:hypothetical protein
MSRVGRLELKLRGLFTRFPDLAFTTDDLCAQCYPADNPVHRSWRTIDRAQRVAVLRAAKVVLDGDPDWRVRGSSAHGQMRVFYNAASVTSTALCRAWLWSTGSLHHRPSADTIPYAAEDVRQHIAIRDAATPQESARLKAGFEAQRDAELAALAVGLRAAFRRSPKLPEFPTQNSDNSPEHRISVPGQVHALMARLVRTAIAENDPDAVRHGLGALLDVLGRLEG